MSIGKRELNGAWTKRSVIGGGIQKLADEPARLAAARDSESSESHRVKIRKSNDILEYVT